MGVWKNCLHCNDKFYVCLSHADGTLFCSRHCRIRYNGPSSIEQLLINELNKQTIPYQFQHKFDRWLLDFAFPTHKIAIEADGVYWHSLAANIQRDHRKNKALEETGWTLFRFTGNEIRESSSVCIDKVLKAITD